MSKRVVLNLSDEVAERLKIRARQVGLPTATFAAFIVGDSLARADELIAQVGMAAFDATGRALAGGENDD